MCDMQKKYQSMSSESVNYGCMEVLDSEWTYKNVIKKYRSLRVGLSLI